MRICYCSIFFFAFTCMIGMLDGSAGDIDPSYRTCLGECEKTGCAVGRCFPNCKMYSGSSSTRGMALNIQKGLYEWWKQLDCKSDCMYHCMTKREKERGSLGLGPVKYHGKWPFIRLFGLQEAASVVLSLLNLAIHFHGWLSFYMLVKYKLPSKADRRPYYDYTGLWLIFGLLSMNSWFWSSVFHSRDVDITEKFDYSSAIALLGYSLILAILRSFSVRDEATRVMISAPILAFITTHILYLNNYKMDYGWNMVVCVVMAVAQLVIWAVWAGVSHHPSRLKLLFVVVGGGLAMLLEIYDFPPYKGLVDAHALWHATTVPLTYIWWSFIKDDAKFRTSSLLKKLKK
ncbi:unnamed protein product [Cuscuta epithymum]|uniref:Post-GPI attachment to proteins factor 3 n=1 Tax=Cuscuta epithymum TaxID=186058 RepID=A0AAV0DF98_9ASTE|nr:unnamed protein product [Cuscuta epithymum]